MPGQRLNKVEVGTNTVEVCQSYKRKMLFLFYCISGVVVVWAGGLI